MPLDPSLARNLRRRYYVMTAATGVASAMGDQDATVACERLLQWIEGEPGFDEAMRGSGMPADLQVEE